MTRGPRPRLLAEDLILLAAAVGLPWLLGGVHLPAYRIAAFLIVASAAVAVARRGPDALGHGGDRRWLVPAFLLVVWGVAQTVPLPPSALATISPAAATILAEAPGGWPPPQGLDRVAAVEEDALARVPEAGPFTVAPPLDAIPPPDAGRWRAASLFVTGTRERLLWFVALLAGFLVSWERSRDPGRSAIYVFSIQGLLVTLAVVALVQLGTWNGRLLWIVPVASRGRTMGPYVNPTDFAAMMEIAVPWLVGAALARTRHAGRGGVEARSLLLAIGAVICAAAAFVAASRMAALLILASVSVVVFAGRKALGTRAAVTGAAILAVTAGAALLAVQGGLGDRIRSALASGSGAGGSDRLFVWRACAEIAKDFPVTGIGVGAFRYVFPRYLVPGEAETWLQAHNDYAELLAGAGFVGLALLLWLCWGYGRRVAAFLRRSSDGARRLPWIGLAAGLASVMLHELVDFSLQIPANALIFVVAAGILLGWRDREHEEPA